MRTGGVWEGERILDDEYVKRATTLQNESATEAKNNPLAKDNFVGYGYQIWMCDQRECIVLMGQWDVHNCSSG